MDASDRKFIHVKKDNKNMSRAILYILKKNGLYYAEGNLNMLTF